MTWCSSRQAQRRRPNRDRCRVQRYVTEVPAKSYRCSAPYSMGPGFSPRGSATEVEDRRRSQKGRHVIAVAQVVDAIPAEQPGRTVHRGPVSADTKPRSLVHGQHGTVVLLEELDDSLVPALAHVGGGRVDVHV